jgi:hypothetical protein
MTLEIGQYILVTYHDMQCYCKILNFGKSFDHDNLYNYIECICPDGSDIRWMINDDRTVILDSEYSVIADDDFQFDLAMS